MPAGGLKVASRDSRPIRERFAARRELRHAAKYGIVGVSNVAIDFLIYAALVSIGVWYPASKMLSFAVATANGYTWNRLWTFRAGGHQSVVLTKYVVVQLVGLGANLALLVWLVEVLGVGQIAGQAVAVPVTALASFMAQRFWTFGYAFR